MLLVLILFGLIGLLYRCDCNNKEDFDEEDMKRLIAKYWPIAVVVIVVAIGVAAILYNKKTPVVKYSPPTSSVAFKSGLVRGEKRPISK